MNLRPSPERDQGIPPRNKPKSAAFTLVELLVVIGIIALLISILLPVLSKARQAANQTKCLSNVAQIVQAFIMYENDNMGWFPHGAIKTGPEHNEDWIWWQSDRIANIADGAVGHYLDVSATNYAVLQCPSDDVNNRPACIGATFTYYFSYSLNNFFRSVDLSSAAGFDNLQGVEKVTSIAQPADKILIIEEDEHTIDDGYATIYPWPSNSSGVPASSPLTNLLALRHDEGRKTQQLDTVSSSTPVPNLQCKGNVGFVDGHAAYEPRSYAHSKVHLLPDTMSLPWRNFPEIPGATP